MAASQLTVAVTGCSGYLAGHVVKTLFEDGNFGEVRGTVRKLGCPEKTAHLDQFGELKLYQANLLDADSFDECFTGVDIVIHCASPFAYGVEDPQTQLIDPAVNGTKNVFEAAIRCGVKRIIQTSSTAAVQTQDSLRNPEAYIGKVFDENDWNDGATLEDGPYRLSKYLAEKKAWSYQDQIEIATINPGFILGPPLSQRRGGESVKCLLGMLQGSYADGVNGACFGCIDVRDVALAHVKAALNPNATGNRFVCVHADAVDKIQMAHYLLPRFKDYPLPTKFADGAEIKYRPTYSNKKLREVLGVVPRPLSTTINEMADAILPMLEN